MTNQNEVEKLYSIKELQALGFGSRSYIDELVKKGKLTRIKLGVNTRFKASEINRFIAEQQG
ncbi:MULTISPECIES: helix-turn-helix transcriptional regulator [Pasteurellaceae]|uniref:Helix-turn-helix domain-containing protein n=1 Tax=Pasteurella atlantica TaxID=2827233 RepID=A0AAW8CSG6_9PAST|nr:helix-turn-helix domain-containing protein [Pasteurella atlantica]MBR0572754.1 helix-turn-helix domain-containing protein [Pasteurella atlantica]MDP8040447.1 helix-turn-helix domain-containing protein [Pasteurella atlantica]MDP8042624.1 helix-turn-helix domain-containing protein [Pasteurella atlantica]MDP8044727.1 helix-turn-helix domain-containing protein [Pasteurella atlantica]MDP8046775.1 helix-turn-helix domain-containing protein [Pasteurella atlantica]